MANKIEVNNLKISFWTNNGAVRAVRDISFKVQEGRTLAIVGESGSGKSVTAKAMLGILAGNSIVEGGEIFYNGIDLMTVEEEFFHQIRGNNIAMIFQDPLSSLNPIMKIGRQITEAMIANNIAARKQGKADYEEKYNALKKYMVDAGFDSAKTQTYLKKFDEFVAEGNLLESEYNIAHDNSETLITDIDGVKIDMIGGVPKEVLVKINRIIKDVSGCLNPFTIDKSDGRVKDLLEKLSKASEVFNKEELTSAEKENVGKVLDDLKNLLTEGNERPKPSFIVLGYLSKQKGRDYLYNKKTVEINEEAEKLIETEFNINFIPMLAGALKYIREKIKENKKRVLPLLDQALQKVEGNIDLKDLDEISKKLKLEIKECINYLDVDKDPICRTFSNAIDKSLRIYSAAMKSENLPKKKKEKMRKKDKLPYELDLESLKDNIRLVLNRVKNSFEKEINNNEEIDYDNLARELILYMDEVSSKMDYKLSKNLAKARAITLMEEVGIPMARQRFYQYPFEFSGGMRQRIVIAIALASNPDVLICDEPTTALDVTIQAQILELINELKRERNLSIIFITHDLGVVANMADDIAVMYAGKIVEMGTVEEIFYESAHPYTWALLSAMPDLGTKEKLEYIPGVPPNMIFPPKGDAFAARNKYAMEIDFEEQPPMFEITPTHSAATWLLHPDAPKVEPPIIVTDRIKRMKDKWEGSNE